MSVQSAPLGPPPPAPASQPAAGAGDESQGDGPTGDPADARSDTPPGSPDHGPAATVPPTPTTIRLLFAKKADAVYAKRDDQPVIYQIDTAVYDKLNAEYHAGGLFTFDQNQVKSVTLQSPDAGLQGFSKEGPTAWKYSVEPDLPIDANKLKNYLVQLKDLKPARYAAYSASDLATFGLDQPQYELTVTLDDGKKERMRVTAKNPTGGGHFAVMNESHDVFILPGDSLARFAIKPADFVSESTPPKVN
jgi:hypothetical protein